MPVDPTRTVVVPRPVPADRAASYRRAGLWDTRSLADGVEAAAAATPDSTAVIDDLRSLSWRELETAITHAIASLRNHGIRAGDPVILVTDNSSGGVVAVHALVRLGAPLLLLDRRVGPADVRAALDALPAPALIVVPSAHRDRLELDATRSIDLESLAAGDEFGAWTEPDRDAPAVMLFTSGTTGRPKTVVHSLNTLGAGAASMAEFTSCCSHDTLFLVSPLASIAGVMQLLLSADQHCTFTLLDDFDPSRSFDRLEEVGGTIIGGAPVIVDRLLATAVDRDRAEVPIRILCLGGAMLSRPLLELATDRFGIEIVRVYGSSEAPNFSSSLRTDDRATRLGDDGALTPGAEARAGSTSHESEGMLRGPSLFLGYLDPEDNEVSFEGDWFRTGDLIEVNDSRITVTGRIKEVVNRSGHKISLTEVDQALDGMPGLAEHACFAVSDPETGERLAVAAVAARAGELTLDEVIAHLTSAGLARHKLPEQLVAWSEPLPRTASGKVIRSQLLRDSPRMPTQLGARLTSSR